MFDLSLAIAHHLLILAAKGGDPEIRGVRRYLHAELALFVFLPIFAAAMARGYGEF
jgi:hypothetical protein